jgi:hypothetical protein
MRLCVIFWIIASMSFLVSMIFSLVGESLALGIVMCNIFGWAMWLAGLISKIRGD